VYDGHLLGLGLLAIFAQGNPRQLRTCRELDGRTSAAKAFDRLVADIESDLGGSDL
jgi:hypothetical protein